MLNGYFYFCRRITHLRLFVLYGGVRPLVHADWSDQCPFAIGLDRSNTFWTCRVIYKTFPFFLNDIYKKRILKVRKK